MNNPQEDLAQELARKRKNNSITTTNNINTQEFQISKRISQNLDHDQNQDHDLLALSLSVRPISRLRRAIRDEESSHSQSQSPFSQSCSIQLPLQISPSRPHTLYIPPFMAEISSPAAPPQPLPPPPQPSRPLRSRRNPTQAPGEGKSDTVPALFPWATTHRATVHSLSYLLSKHITIITGDLQCKKCEKQYEMGYDLRDKFYQVGRFIAENKSSMHDRAPSVWMNPVLPTCKFCDQENCAKPVIPDKKKQINWLFLLLGQLLGCCTLDQLKYFCKHTKNHRTGAKDRVLYLTYLCLCKQLDPNGPFDRY